MSSMTEWLNQNPQHVSPEIRTLKKINTWVQQHRKTDGWDTTVPADEFEALQKLIENALWK